MAEFSNQATLTYTNGTIKSNIITGKTLEVLTAAKYTVSSKHTSCGRVMYMINNIPVL